MHIRETVKKNTGTKYTMNKRVINYQQHKNRTKVIFE